MIAAHRDRAPRNVTPLPLQGDDAALVRAIRSGHPGATTTLVERYGRRVQLTLFRILGPDGELEDAMQDTFLRALESIDRLQNPDALGAWLTGIATNTARTVIQRRQRRWWQRLLPGHEMPEPVGATPGASELGDVYALLKALPVEERIALVLRHVEGMTVKEAALAADTSPATFKRRLARAERRFLERYDDTAEALGLEEESP